MKKHVAIVLLLCVVTVATANARTLYVLNWQSDIPIDRQTIEIDTRGGNSTVVSTMTTDGDKEGYVMVDADIACVVVTWKAKTVTGIPVTVSRQWDAGCYRAYAPISALDTPFAAEP